MRRQSIVSSLAIVFTLMGAAGARAESSSPCAGGVEGSTCTSTADCRGDAPMECIDRRCRFTCTTPAGAPEPSRCSLGETCVGGEGSLSTVYYCQPAPFSMDLNLLDMCLTYFSQGASPVLSTVDSCSLERRLNQLLDQTGDGRFNIFDVDGCIQAYFYRPRCGASGQDSCDPGQTFCASDAACGEGLFCDSERHSCQRECGFLASREPNAPPALERECHGYLKVCNYNRGRCESLAGSEIAKLSCQIDGDCPTGAHCFIGRCAPRCSRSIDCPDSGWYCTSRNRCEPVPKPAGEAGFVFDPKAYVVRFAERSVGLSPLAETYAIPLVVMHLDSKRQVVGNPAVSFGYRLEITNTKKLGPKCQGKVAEADVDDCTIAPEEEFARLLSPFGTVYADEQPFLAVQLDREAYDRLTPGTYQSTLTAIFGNGASDSVTLSVTKTTLSGTYTGRLSIYVLDAQQHLGNTQVSMDLQVSTEEASVLGWNELLARENIEADILDTTRGYPIEGYISGNDSVVFDWPKATRRSENRIPVRGLYSPALGRMRLIGVIDVGAGHCVADTGTCADASSPGAWERLKVENVFGRAVRRVFEFLGPFDARLRQFHGMYRETITGLAPYAITLEGGFQLNQVANAEQKIDVAGPLIACKEPPCAPVKFEEAVVQEEIAAEIASACAGYPEAAQHFASAEGFAAYLGGIHCEAGPVCERLEGRVLEDLMQFGARVQSLVDTVQEAGTALTIYDYLRDQQVFCEAASSGGSQPLCVSEAKLRCGLALYRKALVWGWVPLGASLGSQHRLFCGETGGGGADCLRSGAEAPGVVSLQEHGRFYKQLAEVQMLEAGGALTDALFVMFRAQGDPLLQATALGEKDRQLHRAWASYEGLRRALFSPASAAVLFQWPMWAFLGTGSEWLAQMHKVLRDRRDLLEALIDLKRRLYAAAGEQDFVFTQHVFHEEYLTQVFLIWLQRAWQGERFQYAGTGREMLERAEMILARVNETRNPLGFHADRVFFENNNLQLSSWEKYKAVLGRTGGGGLLQQVDGSIREAVESLRESLSSTQNLSNRIREASHHFAVTIDQLCGPAAEQGAGTCAARTSAEREDMDYVCEDDACSEVMEVFDGAVDKVGDVACRADRLSYMIEVGGTERPCVRGQMGGLLQEKVQLELQRKQIARKLGVLLRQVDAQAKYIQETQRSHEELVEYIEKSNDKMRAIEAGMQAAQMQYEAMSLNAGAADCLIIVGIASGTNCAGKALASALQLAGLAVKHIVQGVLQDQKAKVASAKEVKLQEDSNDATLRQQRLMLENLQAEVENLVSEYEMVTQQLFNLMLRLEDTHFLAKQAVAQHRETLADVSASLIGNEPASVVRRNAKAQEAEEKFAKVLQVAYKMAMAFSHHYNLRDRADELVAKVFRLMTPGDVEKFVEELEAYERSYCAVSGIDCDAQHNTAYYRFSVRDELFPTLTDIVDAQTGGVLTKGEQFHNLLTSSMFRKKRKLGTQLVEQIEVPFAIWLNDRRGQSGIVKAYMVSPLECNHAIAGEGQGTFAVNVVGTRLWRNIQYELWRGNTDFIRSCEPKEVAPVGGGATRVEYPIHSFLVGYAPENTLGRQDVPQQFVTHTGVEVACRNVAEGNLGYVTDESCYNYFARDRSLAAPDWRLVIPLGGSGLQNEWLLGDGVRKEERPVIEDIVVYFRHRKRPIVQ